MCIVVLLVIQQRGTPRHARATGQLWTVTGGEGALPNKTSGRFLLAVTLSRGGPESPTGNRRHLASPVGRPMPLRAILTLSEQSLTLIDSASIACIVMGCNKGADHHRNGRSLLAGGAFCTMLGVVYFVCKRPHLLLVPAGRIPCIAPPNEHVQSLKTKFGIRYNQGCQGHSANHSNRRRLQYTRVIGNVKRRNDVRSD